MREYIHFYGNTVYLEKLNGDMLQFTLEQFQLLKLIGKKLNNDQIITTLLKKEKISEEQKQIINKNINAFRDLCVCNNITFEDWKITGIQ